MKRKLWLLLLLSLFSASVWSQQAKTQPTKKTTANPVKNQVTTSPLKTNPITDPSTTSNKNPSTIPKGTTKKTVTKPAETKTAALKPKTTTTAVIKDSVSADTEKKESTEESTQPMAVYVKDTATRYLTGSLKMGDEYISSRYTPPTITLLFINDLFDRAAKEMDADDFMADKLEIGDKFYLNQQSISAKKKKEFLEEIHKHSSASLLPKLYNGDKLNKLKNTARWSDTTFSIAKERIAFGVQKTVAKDVKSNSGKSAVTNISPTDSMGNTILYALLKKDIPATTMKVWCDPKAVLQKSKDLLTTSDLAVNKDPKKKLIYQDLLKQNFILVVGFSNVHEVYENIYSKDNKGRTIIVGTKPTGRYECDVRSFLYKIEMTPTTLSNLGSSCDTRRIPVRYAYRFNLPGFSMGAKHYTVNRRKFVNGSFVVIPEEVHLTEKEFSQNAIQSATNDIFEELEAHIDEFKMRSGVTQVKPFYASEMGERQGVYRDQRYDVYRYEKNIEKNEVNATRIATVRMTKIAKNRNGEKESKPTASSSALSSIGGLSSNMSNFSLFKEHEKPKETSAKVSLASNKEPPKSSTPVESGDSLHKWSHFKPITLGGIEKGDFLLQNDDRGISAIIGYNHNNIYPSVMLGAELNLNVLLRSSLFPNGLKLGAWINFITNDYKFHYYDEEDGKYKDSKSYFSIYLAKDFYLTRIVDISPFVAYEFAGGNGGLRFGTQIPLNIYKGRVKLTPHVSIQTLTQAGKTESARPCFGVLTKFDF